MEFIAAKKNPLQAVGCDIKKKKTLTGSAAALSAGTDGFRYSPSEIFLSELQDL
jgi:hypothetical protein